MYEFEHTALLVYLLVPKVLVKNLLLLHGIYDVSEPLWTIVSYVDTKILNSSFCSV
jgi:hypothetical protein